MLKVRNGAEEKRNKGTTLVEIFECFCVWYNLFIDFFIEPKIFIKWCYYYS